MKWRTYPAYRDSGVEWLGEIPEHWEILKIRRITKHHKQGYYTEEPYVDEGVKLIRITDIDDFGNTSFEHMPFVSISERDETAFKANHGDFVFARSGTVGRFGLVLNPDRSVFASYLIRFIFGMSTPEYVKCFFLSKYFKESLISTLHGGANQNVHAENIKNQWICTPNPNEQQAIAAFLDRETSRIDELIAKKQRQIELLQEKRSALISHVVTKGLDPDVKMKDSGVEWLGVIPEHWKQLAIKRLSIVKRGASPRPIDDPKYFDEDGEYSWVRIADVTASSRYLETTTQRLSDLGKSLSVPLSPGSLFISIAGTVGKPIIAKIKCCIHDGFVYFPQYKEDANFLYYIFASGQPYQGLGKWGTQLNLNTDTVGWIQFGLPPIDEQRAIAAFLDQETSRIDELIAKITQSIDLLREYRTALISAAVTGKIDIREEVA